MSRTRIKFCGMTRVEDALAAAMLGIDAIGIVLTPRSPRYVSPRQAREIQRALPPFVTTVALFMDDEPGFIAAAVNTVQPDLLQFHGSETLEDCVRYDVPYVKAIAMGGGDPASAMREHTAAVGFLFDAHAPGEQGGAGRAFDWSRIPQGLTRPLILAGGLTPENVAAAVRGVAPFGVDVASGIEAAPGIKDGDKMRRFVAAVRESEKV